MMNNIKKISKTLLNVVIVTIIAIAAVVTIVSLNTKDKGVADINGYIPFSIQSESMTGTIDKGDLIITKKYTNQVLEKGDIISFFAVEQEKTIIKTHRIIEIKIENGKSTFVTKGDFNEVADSTAVEKENIVSVYGGSRFKYLGTILDFFKSKYGFLICIILPIFCFFLYQLYSFVTILIETKKERGKTI